ncbi:MAG: Trm112 family protein [Terriglobales bacterium]
MLSKELLDILACPECKTPLIYDEPAAKLRCSRCRRAYPVRDGLPVLLIEEATIE